MITDEGFIPLPIPVPPMLEKALGYPGRLQRPGGQPAQYCAFYWVEGGDEATFDDGRRSSIGMLNNEASLAFVRHAVVAPHLHGYNLGSSEDSADYWLILDRHTPRKLYLAPVEAGQQLVTRQWGPPSTSQEGPLVVANQEELQRLVMEALSMNTWTETTTTGSTQAAMQAIQEQWEQGNELIAWLNALNYCIETGVS